MHWCYIFQNYYPYISRGFGTDTQQSQNLKISKMLPKFIRAAIALTSTALIVPYAVAFITELLYGKSAKSHNRYLRALHPYRVYALNLALLSTLTKLKYAKLYLKWTKHYKSLSLDRVVKVGLL